MARTAKENVVDNAKKAGDEILGVGRKAYLVGLGAFASAEEQAVDWFDQLISKGETFEKDDKRIFVRAKHEAQEFGGKLEARISRVVSETLARAGIPSGDEIRTLTQRVEELTSKVEELAKR
jgi:polyhydroxyalkanoate synthesis regulator phasin